jgi:hypothetical protein
MSGLAAVQIEVQRQLEHVNWMESFLKYQKEARVPCVLAYSILSCLC